MKLLNILTFCLILTFTSSCQRGISTYLRERPERKFRDTLRDATPDFRQGWYDGCEVGMSSGSNTFYKMFYRNNQIDGWKMTSSPEYKTAWSNAFWYCYRYDEVKQGSSIWSSVFGGMR